MKKFVFFTKLFAVLLLTSCANTGSEMVIAQSSKYQWEYYFENDRLEIKIQNTSSTNLCIYKYDLPGPGGWVGDVSGLPEIKLQNIIYIYNRRWSAAGHSSHVKTIKPNEAVVAMFPYEYFKPTSPNDETHPHLSSGKLNYSPTVLVC